MNQPPSPPTAADDAGRWVSARLVGRRPESWRGEVLFVEAPADTVTDFTVAGQYCELEAADAGGHFAIARAPGPGPLEFYVQQGGTAAAALARLPVGRTLRLGPVSGRGYGVEAAVGDARRLVFLATGSGMASLRGALEVVAAAGRVATVYYGCRDPGDFIFLPDLLRHQAAGFKVVLTASRRDAPGWLGRTGYIGDHLTPELKHAGESTFFLCGVPKMEHALRAWLLGHGVPPEHVRTNY